jgi:pyruvate,water dikinase
VIELLPDPLSPLFATLAVPPWNKGYQKLTALIGFGRAMPAEFLVTINDYAYYDATQFAGFRTLLAMPRVLATAFRWLARAEDRWAREARPSYQAVVFAWAARDLRAAAATELLDGARAIVQSAADHYLTIQSGILPVSYTSEMIFTGFYKRLVQRSDDPPALTFLLGFDSAPILAEKSLYDIATWTRSREDLAGYITGASGAEIAAAYRSLAAPTTDAEAWREFCGQFARHLERFGHTIYDLDFAKALAADEPAPLFETLKYFLTGAARSPHERQSQTAEAREQATELLLSRLKGLRRRWFTRLLRWAQRYAPLREDALADVGLGWPLMRRMLHELARRLLAAGSVSGLEDVFWLKLEEATAAARCLDANQSPEKYQHAIANRRAAWERYRRVTPPIVLPIKGGARFWGIDFSRWMPARTDQPAGDTLRGIGTSPGRVTGVARVIHGPSEFDQMRPGDILTAKITTPAWTPLFAMASGIVADVGGPLSHSSIVAREYQIPAVLGTGLATERIRSGQRITVDGDLGLVIIASENAPAIAS